MPRRNSKGDLSNSLRGTSTSKPLTIHEDDGRSLRRAVSMPTALCDVKSIMKYATLDESLHSTFGGNSGGVPLPDRERTERLQFADIVIREYARTVGDNPSCSSGPPVTISWEYLELGSMPLEQYEESRPPRRSNFEMVLPRKVRFDMLKREWEVSQKQIASAVRQNVKVKNQRKATVNNLGKATKFEEIMESAARKVRRFITFQKPCGVQVQQLEKKLDDAQRIRAQYRLEQAMASEYSVNSSSPLPDVDDTTSSS